MWRTFSLAFLTAACVGCGSAGRNDVKSQRQQMVDEQLAARGIRNDKVLAVMRRVPRHDFGLDKMIVGCRSSNDNARCDAALVFVNTLGDAIEKLWRWIAVTVSRRAEDDDSVDALAI